MQDIEELEEPKRIRINFWVPASIYQSLEEIAKRDGLSMSEILRCSLKDHIIKDKQEQKLFNGGG
jgi:hypothetical protein